MTFDISTHYQKAVVKNIRLWQRRILAEKQTADRWRVQHEAVWQAVDAGLGYVSAQAETAVFVAALLPTIERWGVWPDWLPLLDMAMTLALAPDLQIRLRLTQARLHILNRNFHDAIELLEVTLLLACEQQLTPLIALAHYRLTNAYLGSKAYAEARKHAAKAITLLSPSQRVTQAALYNSLGLLELESGAFAESEAWFHKAVTLWRELDDPTQLARSCLNLSVVYQRQNRWAEAKACYEQASAALSATDSVVDKLKALNELGTLQYMTEDFSAAVATFRQGVTAVQKLQGMYHLRGSLTHNLGNALLASGHWVEARGYLEKSIGLWQQANDALERANSLGTLGEVFEAQAEWALAVSSYRQALELLGFYPDHPWAQKLAAQFQTAKARCATLTDPASNSG